MQALKLYSMNKKENSFFLFSNFEVKKSYTEDYNYLIDYRIPITLHVSMGFIISLVICHLCHIWYRQGNLIFKFKHAKKCFSLNI